ncbi:MAG: bifunctional phosphopantothenoylcysteine decarboxylase/phosphopantothenate--cysteine ligase CoaBC [Polyangia bacterium]
MQDKEILLGITGGIAAYKSAEICRALVKRGARVQVVMTRAAREFATPLTLETLSGRPVGTELFSDRLGPVPHISLADRAEIVLVAPATADFLARCAQGRAGDLLSALTLAFTGPVLAAPAMNTNMWRNPATRRNVALLAGEHGWRFVDPGSGELACGWSGTGRMAEPEEIIASLGKLTKRDLEGLRVLIAAGPTVEDIDPVRYLTNRSSGRTGYALARLAARRGAETVLVSGPTALDPPPGVSVVDVRSAVEMDEEVRRRASGVDAVIMAAAVADYRPETTSDHKMKKSDETLRIELVRNPDILASLGRGREKGSRPLLVGFALETRDLLEAARAKLKSKGADLLVANLADRSLGGESSEAIILDDSGGEERVGPADKEIVAARILDRVVARLDEKQGTG